MVRRTNPPPNYIQPSNTEVENKASKLELKKFSIPLVRDMANIAAGGNFIDYTRILVESQEGVKVKTDSDGDYMDEDNNYLYDSRNNYISNYNEARGVAAVKKASYHQNINEFIKGLDLDNVPGKTPLERSVNMVKILSESDNSQCDNSENNGENLPIFKKSNGKKLAEEVNKIFEDMKNLNQEEKSLMQSDDFSNETDEDKNMSQMSLATDMVHGKNIWLKISRKLDSLVNLRTFAYRKTVADIEGKSVRTRAIENPNEINKLASAEWANPKSLRLFRIATRQAQIRERVSIIEKKQLLYLLIDSSGSMSGDRIHTAGGVLMNRLKAVIKGEAEVFVRFFDDEVYQEHHASNPEESRELMKVFEQNNFSGGNTRISRSLEFVRDDIEKKMKENDLLVRPEIVIVTDGEDDVSSLKAKEFKPTVVHSIIVKLRNEQLGNFSRATGGVTIQNL